MLPCSLTQPSSDTANLHQFDQLLEAAHSAQASLFAEGTKRNHKSNITQFMFFCQKFDQPVCPTTRDTLMAFARLASMTVSYGTLKNIFSSIKFLHKACNETYPEDDWQLESTLKALKRELSGAPFRHSLSHQKYCSNCTCLLIQTSPRTWLSGAHS